ncbi:hypothetical protein GF339_09575, partial [candidate division KSB3 bacterium]|nr:hypothetical protein [candidate division KSB3 bacterium]MBD3324822.1 hypothetical protein [candidate division KSB3 bacterium]
MLMEKPCMDRPEHTSRRASRRRFLSCVVVGAFVGLLLLLAEVAALEYPEPTSWVNDYARVLRQREQDTLDAVLEEFETTTSTQIFVAIQERIPGEMTIEEYAVELFERWQPGQEGQD